jgi:hypothetical protein
VRRLRGLRPSNRHLQALALAGLVKVLASVDAVRAAQVATEVEHIARTITNRHFQAQALAGLVKVLASVDAFMTLGFSGADVERAVVLVSCGGFVRHTGSGTSRYGEHWIWGSGAKDGMVGWALLT